MHANLGTRIRITRFVIILLGVLFFAFGVGSLLSVHAQDGDAGYFSIETFLSDGKSIDGFIINGPPTPPPGYELERAAVDLSGLNPKLALHSLDVPAYDWVFGCSSVSGAMIAAFYDRNGFPNMYTGPTDAGVMPMNNSAWGTWSDGYKVYPNLPLAASHNGVDGRTTRGSIDDYWISYESNSQDPYITNAWTQHTWGDAIGDYMKTSQSAFYNNDGSSRFYTYTTSAAPLTCSQMATLTDPNKGGKYLSELDGTYGRKLFYEARGYTVTDCYNRTTDNMITGGFSLADFKAEIDAGRPVMINLAGHTIAGVGYDDSSNNILVHDTWDYDTHTMPWGGSYQGMTLQSVSIVNLQRNINMSHFVYLPLALKAPPLPGSFNKSAPLNGATGQPASPSLSWGTSAGAVSYQYCVDTSNDNSCNTSWVSTGTGTGASLSGLSPSTTYYWQVQAVNTGGLTSANAGVWWSFTTSAGSALPKPGYWLSDNTSHEFYVNTGSNLVKHYAVTVTIPDCGTYIITHMTDVPITSNQFSFSGPFYVSSGVFNSATTATVTDGLDNFLISDCGMYVTGGPWTRSFSWIDSSQPTALTAHVVGPITAASGTAPLGESVKVTPLR